MTRNRLFLVISEPPRAASNVLPLRRPRVPLRAMPLPASKGAQPRETSWRDLVRRLVKTLAER